MKTTKRALFSSVMALILCFSMLVGTTFAWFTDEVKSDVNKIVAGNLDVDVVTTADDKSIENQSVLFDEIKLWEPGVVAYENITVKNLGTLALKYQLSVNFDDENYVVEADGTVTDNCLADVLMVSVIEETVDAALSREEVLTKAGEGVLLSELVKNGKLESLQNQNYAIIIWWPQSTNDDTFNINNGKSTTDGEALHINLGLKVLATQLDADIEQDSFGSDYDKDAWHPDMLVSKASELAAAIEAIPDGGIIALSENLTFDQDSAVNSGGNWYEGLYYVGDKSFTIDLNGKTITNDTAVNDYLMLFKNDGAKANTITIKNGTLEAASSAYCAICTSTTSTQKITINLENVDVIGNNSNGSVIKIRGGAELNVKAGTVITGKNSYLGIENWAATVNIYDGTEIYQNGTTSYNGCLVGVGGNGTVNVYGGYGKGVAGGFIAMTSGGTINVSGGEWIADTDSTVSGNDFVLIAQNDKNTYPSAGRSVVNVTGGTFYGGYNCYSYTVADDAQINISAGTFNADPSAYVADGCHALYNGEGYLVLPESVNAIAYDAATLQAALDAATGEYSILLVNDITGDVTAVQKENVKITIDGAGKTFNGGILVNGQSQRYETAALTIQNVNFNADGISSDACIRLGKSGDTNTRYTNHVTVKDCTFTGTGLDKVAVKSYEGGDYNVTLDNLTVNAGMHSLAQLKNVEQGLKVVNCKVYSKNGLNVNNSFYLEMDNCEFDVLGYAVRFGSDAGVFDRAFSISNSTLKSACNDGDPVIEFRKGSVVSTLTLTNTTLEGTTIFKGNTADTTIIIDGVEQRVASSQAELNSAVAAGGKVVIELDEGNYTMPTTNGDVTISGTKDTIISGNDATAKNVTFNGVTIQSTGAAYTGIKHSNTVVYNDVTIVGNMYLYAENVVFNNCTFDLSSTNDYIWVYGATNVEFNNCTFNTMGKAILVFQDGSKVNQTVKVEGCTFNASQAAYNWDKTIHIAAVSCDGSQGGTYNVILNNNTVDADFNGLWQDKTSAGNITVTVDGATVLNP